MVRRITDKASIVETVTWPSRRPAGSVVGSGLGGLAVPVRATELVSSKPAASNPPSSKPEGNPPETAQFERRIAELERLKQLETVEAHHRGV
jgi:hypothetical protein